MIKKLCLVTVLILIVFSLVGCQTVQGLGQDLQWLGEKTTQSAGGN